MTTRIEFTHCTVYLERPHEGYTRTRCIEVTLHKKELYSMEFLSNLLAATKFKEEDGDLYVSPHDVMTEILFNLANKHLTLDYCRPFDDMEELGTLEHGGPNGEDLFGGVSYHYTPLQLNLDPGFPDRALDSHFEVLEEFGEEDYLLVEARVYPTDSPHGGEYFDSYEFIIPKERKYDYEISY